MDKKVRITAYDGGEFDGYLFASPTSPRPGLIMIPEIFGVNQPLREVAQRFSDHGYTVLLLDIFWRLAPNIELGYDKASYKEAFAYHEAFDYDVGVLDIQTGIDHLRAREECSGTVGVVGFCLGGTMAYLAAARCDSEAAVGYYGTRIQNFLDNAASIERPLILHFGEIDHTTPPEIMAQILPAIEPNPHITKYIYKSAGHAFANHRRAETYHAEVTHEADARTFSFFEKWLETTDETKSFSKD